MTILEKIAITLVAGMGLWASIVLEQPLGIIFVVLFYLTALTFDVVTAHLRQSISSGERREERLQDWNKDLLVENRELKEMIGQIDEEEYVNPT